MPMAMQHLTLVIFVDEIEPCLGFWTDRLGYEIHVDVKDGDRYGFVLLGRDGVQVMYQTRRSLAQDLPQLEPKDRQTSAFLYLLVDDLEAIERAMDGVPLVQPRRTAPYGATEFAVREPGGNIVMFAQHGHE